MNHESQVKEWDRKVAKLVNELKNEFKDKIFNLT